MPTGNDNRPDLHEKAFPFIAHYLDLPWPEDTWEGVDSEIDLNFWLYEDDNGVEWKVCTLYDVVAGETKPDTGVTLFSEMDWSLTDYVLHYLKNYLTKDEFNLDFVNSGVTCRECCPECVCENECTMDGKTVCSFCGHTDMLPCTECKEENLELCDWTEAKGCTPFPK